MVSPSAACERRDCIRISPAGPGVRRFTQADFFCPLAIGSVDPPASGPHDAADDFALTQHVVVVLTPLAGQAGSRRAFQD